MCNLYIVMSVSWLYYLRLNNNRVCVYNSKLNNREQTLYTTFNISISFFFHCIEVQLTHVDCIERQTNNNIKWKMLLPNGRTKKSIDKSDGDLTQLEWLFIIIGYKTHTQEWSNSCAIRVCISQKKKWDSEWVGTDGKWIGNAIE